MALVTMQDVLKVAEEKKIAIAAFTVDTLEVAEEIASVAEEKQLPAIMMVGQNTFKYNKLEKIASICRQIANSTNAQLVLHLDHGASYEQVIQCLRNGFTSVMIDGSRLPLKENIRVTKEVTRAAHTVGVSVEAEARRNRRHRGRHDRQGKSGQRGRCTVFSGGGHGRGTRHRHRKRPRHL
ncbi:MAG: class II fructose-bisphosphate aldolase [Oscillospiraceae bacterium]